MNVLCHCGQSVKGGSPLMTSTSHGFLARGPEIILAYGLNHVSALG